jgi:drug/metabolite transporter (DMT)-like permease
MTKPQILGIVYASICAMLWSVLALGLKFALSFSDVETICWFRFTVALLISVIFVFFKYGKNIGSYLSPFPKQAIFAGLGLTLNYWGYFKCLELTSPSNAQILIQVAPLCLAAIGIFVFKEQVTQKQTSGFLIAMIGLCLFNGEQISHALQNISRYIKGNLVMLVSIVGWTTWGVLNKKLIQKIPISIINTIIFFIGSLALLPTINPHQIASFSLFQWTVVTLLGVNTVAAYSLISKAFSLVETSKVSFIITLNPLGTIVLMKLLAFYEVSWIGYEKIGPVGLIGATLLLSGVILVVGTSKKPKVEMDKPDLSPVS